VFWQKRLRRFVDATRGDKHQLKWFFTNQRRLLQRFLLAPDPDCSIPGQQRRSVPNIDVLERAAAAVKTGQLMNIPTSDRCHGQCLMKSVLRIGFKHLVALFCSASARLPAHNIARRSSKPRPQRTGSAGSSADASEPVPAPSLRINPPPAICSQRCSRRARVRTASVRVPRWRQPGCTLHHHRATVSVESRHRQQMAQRAFLTACLMRMRSSRWRIVTAESAGTEGLSICRTSTRSY
jgi:hypothetical protein